MLVQHKGNKTHYAMKILDKQKVSCYKSVFETAAALMEVIFQN